MDQSIISAIKDNSGIIKIIYKDLAHPGIAKIGKAIGTVLDLSNTILLPIKLLNEKSKLLFKSRMDMYREKLEEIPEEKINEVPPSIGIPIIDRLTYITEDEISEKFINLLANASSKDTVDGVHPSFIQMIDRLTVDEARILEHLHAKQMIPFINVGILSNDNSTISTFSNHLTGIEKDVQLKNPKSINIYLDNLTSMGILIPNESTSLKEEKRYKELESLYPEIINYCDTESKFSPLHWGSKVHIVNGFFQISDFGRNFIWACMKKNESSKIYKKGKKVKHPDLGIGEIIVSHNDEQIGVQFSQNLVLFEGEQLKSLIIL